MLTNNEPLLEPLLRQMRLQRVKPYISPNTCLLDVGCGTSATFLKAISPYIKQGVGVDFKVENTQIGNIQTTQLKFHDHLPFEDESFDVVTMLAVLEHIENEGQILQEIKRVLIPSGKLIITVPSVWSQPILEFLSYNLKIISEKEIQDHKRYYTKKLLKNKLVEIGGFHNFYHQYFQYFMNNFCIVTKGDLA